MKIWQTVEIEKVKGANTFDSAICAYFLINRFRNTIPNNLKWSISVNKAQEQK